MNWGLDDKTLSRVRRILATFPEVDRAVLYGSRAMGTNRPGSDIDLTLHGERLDWKLCAEIASMFEASSIPYRVDVSVWHRLTHEDLKDHIRRRGVVLFDRDVWDAEQAAARAAQKGATEEAA